MSAGLHSNTNGHTRASYTSGGSALRLLVKEIVEKDEDISIEEAVALFVRRMTRSKKRQQEFVEALAEYFVTNTFKYLRRRPTDYAPREDVREEAARIAKAVVKVILLDMVMPNGKKLRRCTGAECAAMGGRLAKIGLALDPGVLVGTLTEDRVRELYSA